MSEHERMGRLGYELIKKNCDQARLSRWLQPMPDDPTQRIAAPREQWVDVLVMDFMKTFQVPQLVVKEVLFKDQLNVRRI